MSLNKVLSFLVFILILTQISGCGSSTSSNPEPPTEKISISENLDPRAFIPPAFSSTNPTTTSNHSISVTVYDSLGVVHVVTVYFRKSIESRIENTWEYFAVVGASDSISAVDTVGASGTLVFDPFGRPISITSTVNNFDFSGDAEQDQVIEFDFGTPTEPDAIWLDGTIQRGSSESPTSFVSISENLDPAASIFSVFSVANPAGTSNHSISTTVYDSLGVGHLISVYFRKSAVLDGGNQWQYFALVDASDSTSGTVEQAASGVIQFDLSGRLNSIFLGIPDFDFVGGCIQNQTISFLFGSTTVGGGSGLDGTTQI